MKRFVLAILAVTCVVGINAVAEKGGNPHTVVWADCELYDAVVAPNQLPPHGNFDQLYAMPGAAFQGGVALISESKPGDRDYNGGRWHLNILKEGVDPAKYANACHVDDLDLGDFEGTGNLFSCPLLPHNDRE